MTKYEPIILIIASMILFGFILGWIFPVEGPIDYVYDNAIKQKSSSKGLSSIKQKKVFLDLEEDGILESYYLVPLNDMTIKE